MQAPARGPGDLHIANGAETNLFIPEKAKDTGAPKRFSHVSFFAFVRSRFHMRVVGIRIRLHFDVSLDGRVTGA
jgi:hypothetical protein